MKFHKERRGGVPNTFSLVNTAPRQIFVIRNLSSLDICALVICHLVPSDFSIAPITSSESGFTFESQRAKTFPSGPIKNFPKFHYTSPGNPDFSLVK